jgi:anthranilate phosphoribosyltransferase
MSLQHSVETLMRGQNLTRQQCQQVLETIVSSSANPIQTAAFLVLLRSKPETADELAEMAQCLQQTMLPLPTPHRVLDIVGTGGDQAHTVNISTGSAILAASCGVKIAKHGNRAASSLAGSADVLEALGISLDLSTDKICASIDQIGIGFCFAPNFHPLLRQIRAIRQQLRIPTTFNLLGPLLNPACPAHLLLGVYDATLLAPIAAALQKMGTRHSLVTYGQGLDELSCIGPAQVIEIKHSQLNAFMLDPANFGLARCALADLKGGDASANAQRLRDALTPSAYSHCRALADTLILNAGIAVYLYGRASTMGEAIAYAREHLFSGAGLTLLNNWIEFSHD